MTKIRLTVLAILAVSAVMAVSASAASAFTEFTPVGAKTTAAGKEQVLTATESGAGKKVVTVKCKTLTGEGEIKSKTEAVASKTTYEGCTVAGLAAKVTNKCVFTFLIGGTVNLSGGASCATVEVASTKCLITITGEQTGLKTAEYANIKTTSPLESEIKGAVGGVNFSSATGKACAFATEAVTGTASYTGNAVVTGANVL